MSDIATVSENEIARVVLLLAERGRLVVEPSGAAGVAALLQGHVPWEPPVAVILSGGNIDTLMFNRILRYGLVAAGRFVRLEVRIPDRPGSLASLLGVLASTEGNVVNVSHNRITGDLDLSEVRIGVELETKGHEHCREILTAMRAVRYGVSIAVDDVEAAVSGQ